MIKFLRRIRRENTIYQKSKFVEKSISSSGGGMNRVKDTIYMCFGLPLKKHLTYGDKVTIWFVKSNGEKTNIKFDLMIQ